MRSTTSLELVNSDTGNLAHSVPRGLRSTHHTALPELPALRTFRTTVNTLSGKYESMSDGPNYRSHVNRMDVWVPCCRYTLFLKSS